MYFHEFPFYCFSYVSSRHDIAANVLPFYEVASVIQRPGVFDVTRWIQTLAICRRPRAALLPQHKGAVARYFCVATIVYVFSSLPIFLLIYCFNCAHFFSAWIRVSV